MISFDLSSLVLTRLQNAYVCRQPRHTEGEAVTPFPTLLLRESGTAFYTVGKKEITVDASHALFLPAGTAYSFEVDRMGAVCILQFEIADPAAAGKVPVSLHLDSTREIFSSAVTITRFFALKGPACHAKCLSELYNLFARISGEDSTVSSLAGKYGLIHQSVKYIEKNYSDPDLYTPQLAEMSGIGETYYRNIFIAVFGMPPTRYIQQFRVEKAKEMLLAGEYPVEDIAVAVGFANASYFCKVFKSVTGLTPGEFQVNGKLLG